MSYEITDINEANERIQELEFVVFEYDEANERIQELEFVVCEYERENNELCVENNGLYRERDKLRDVIDHMLKVMERHDLVGDRLAADLSEIGVY